MSKAVPSGRESRSSENVSDPKLSAELSRTEHFRLTRAFYYVEFYGQLFGATTGASLSDPENEAVDALLRATTRLRTRGTALYKKISDRQSYDIFEST